MERPPSTSEPAPASPAVPPTERVRIDHPDIEHIAERHLNPAHEPWHELLPADLLEELLHSRPIPPDTAARFRQHFVPLVCTALDHGLTLSYECLDPSTGARRGRSAVAVLRCGAVAVLRHDGPELRLKTAYFRAPGLIELSAERCWRRAAVNLVWKYARRTQAGLFLPDTAHRYEKRDLSGVVKVIHTEVRFGRPEAWGWPPDGLWRGRLSDWPGEAPPGGPRLRLKPRR
jgi:hypothetical protein